MVVGDCGKWWGIVGGGDYIYVCMHYVLSISLYVYMCMYMLIMVIIIISVVIVTSISNVTSWGAIIIITHSTEIFGVNDLS